MPLDKISEQELTASIALARKTELPFGLCMGKVPDTTVLVTNRNKSPEVLAKQAKQTGETPQVTFGVMTVAGKLLTMTLLGKPLPSLEKRLRAFLKAAGLSMKVEILIPEGEGADGQAQDEHNETTADPKPGDSGEPESARNVTPQEDAPETGTKDTAQPSDALINKWVILKKKFSPLVKDAAASKAPNHDKISLLWAFANKAARENPPNYKSAIQTVGQINKLMSRDAAPEKGTPDTGSANKLAANWDQAKHQIDQAIASASSTPGIDLTRIESAWLKVQNVAEKGDYAKALKGARQVGKALSAASNSAQKPKPDPAQAKWLAVSGKIGDRVKQAVDAKLDNHSDIQNMWERANSHATSAPPDYGAALSAAQSVVQMVKEAKKAAANKPQAEPLETGTVETTPAANDPVETTTATAEPVETTPAETTPAGDPPATTSTADPKRKLPDWRVGGDDNVDVIYANADGKVEDGAVEGTIGLGMIKMSHDGHFGSSPVGGSHDMEALSAEAEGHLGVGKGIGGKGQAGARFKKESGTVFAGSDKNNPLIEVGGEYELLTAEAKGDFLIGSDGKRAGLALGGSAGATAAKGDVKGSISLPIPFMDSWTIEFSGKGGGQVGSASIGAQAHVMHDLETGRSHVGLGGEIAAFFGVEFDFDISVGPKYDSRERPNGP